MNTLETALVGSCGDRRNIADIPRTKQAAFFLLDHVAQHLRNSGKIPYRCAECHKYHAYQRFTAPQETYQEIERAIQAVKVKWVRKQKTSRAKLQIFRKLRRRVRRVAHKDDVLVFQKSAVPVMRAALPALYGQGFLRKRVRVYPYRESDAFLGRHPVKVYKQGSLFDVIDAHCSITILAGITARALKQFVAW